MENRTIGAIAAITGYVLALIFFMNAGLTLTSMAALSLAGLAFVFAVIGGSIIYDYLYDDVVEQKKVWAGALTLLFGLGTVFALPFLSTAYGDVMGYGQRTAPPAPEEPAFPSYMRGSVVNALSSPQTAISDASIKYYDTEPQAGVGQVALYTDNTDSSGSFMTEVKESEGTLLWATASKSNYYAEKDSGTTGESGSGATNLNFNNYGNGLTKIGTFSDRLTNLEPSDNIQLSGNEIQIENDANTTFTFNLVIETSASETAIRDLYAEMEEGSAYDNEGVEMEVITVEDPDYGTLSASKVGGQYVWDSNSTETQIQFDGDLQYRKDIVIRFTIESDDATVGTVVSFDDLDDLSGGVGLEGGTGISTQTLSIKTYSGDQF